MCLFFVFTDFDVVRNATKQKQKQKEILLLPFSYLSFFWLVCVICGIILLKKKNLFLQKIKNERRKRRSI